MGHVLLVLLLLLAACAGPAADTASLPAGAQADGQHLYESSCQRCHALYMPESFTMPEWKFFVRKYGRKARLSKAQRAVVLEYLSDHCLGGNGAGLAPP